MSRNQAFIPNRLKPWIDARRQWNLSHMQVQMARELGMNPKKFGKLANHKQEPWKAPLPVFIEECYFKRFGKERPDDVGSIEERLGELERKREQRRLRKQHRR